MLGTEAATETETDEFPIHELHAQLKQCRIRCETMDFIGQFAKTVRTNSFLGFLYWNDKSNSFFTARIRRMGGGGGNIFSLSVHTRGKHPSPMFFPRSFSGGTSVPGSFLGHWSQILSRGYPSPPQGVPRPGQGVHQYSLSLARSGWGTPLTRSGWGTPSQD